VASKLIRRGRRSRRALGAIVALVVSSSHQGLAADAAQGEKLARRWCAACHVVAADQTRGTDNVPTFQAIGKTPGLSAEKVAKFLRDPHPKMPDMQLSNAEAADLAAYIVSLGK
jgi:mono/diheme cytochrome c family protein